MLPRFLIRLGFILLIICFGFTIWIDTHPDAEVGRPAILFGVIGVISLFTGLCLKLVNGFFNKAESAAKFIKTRNEFLKTDEGRKLVQRNYRKILKAEKKAKDPLNIRED
jgi:hypothetical protein